mmetsp:Transcript_32305/g.106826  ORF Transcript_32305/g.106826 Transcript_32305/m.106826 type:complete len:248 (-) Transcript_32305:25-768(-)
MHPKRQSVRKARQEGRWPRAPSLEASQARRGGHLREDGQAGLVEAGTGGAHHRSHRLVVAARLGRHRQSGRQASPRGFVAATGGEQRRIPGRWAALLRAKLCTLHPSPFHRARGGAQCLGAAGAAPRGPGGGGGARLAARRGALPRRPWSTGGRGTGRRTERERGGCEAAMEASPHLAHDRTSHLATPLCGPRAPRLSCVLHLSQRKAARTGGGPQSPERVDVGRDEARDSVELFSTAHTSHLQINK